MNKVYFIYFGLCALIWVIMRHLLLLLFVGVSCTHKYDKPLPSYFQAKFFLIQALETITAHVLSMQEGIPELTDHRRHYAVIFHVIYSEARNQAGCLIQPFDVFYQRNINKSAPEGLSNPEGVVEETKALLEDFNGRTRKIQELLTKYCGEGHGLTCDEDIDRNVNYYLSPLKDEAKVLLAAGAFGKEFFNHHAEFAAVSYDLNAIQYIINAGNGLEELVNKFAQALRTLMPEQKC